MATQGQVIPPGQDDEDEIVQGESSLSVHEEADRSHQVATAKKYPRSITEFRKNMLAIAMANQAVAMEMMYSVPRAGKTLVGPSVRFAEALITCWGNARCGVEVVDVDTKDGVVVAEGRFYDCENNVGFAIRTRRRNVGKKDADGYQVTGQAASSIALRNAILRGVPKALWADIFEKAKATATGGVASMDKIKDELSKFFAALGITEVRLLRTLQIPGMPDMGPDEILAMQAWRKQLGAKETTLEEIFGSPEDEEIEWLTSAMGWSETQKRMAKGAFGSKTEHLNHVRGEAGKSGITYSSAKSAQPKPKTSNGPGAGPQEVKKESADPTTQASSAGNPFAEAEKTTTAKATGTTAEASTSPASEDVSEKW